MSLNLRTIVFLSDKSGGELKIPSIKLDTIEIFSDRFELHDSEAHQIGTQELILREPSKYLNVAEIRGELQGRLSNVCLNENSAIT